EYSFMLNMGIMYMEAEKEEKAEDVFSRVTQQNPEDFTAWYLLGLARLYLKNYESAWEALNKAIEIEEDPDVYFNLGVTADNLGKEEEAYHMFEKSIQMDPDHDLSLNYLGYLWADNNINIARAEEYIKRALELNPDKPGYIDSLGWVYYRQGLYMEAFKKIHKAAKMARDPEIFEHLGDTYLALNKPAGALRIYRETLKMDPDNEKLLEKINNLK
ncbi:MAG: tetratricopeptide repeat protein, partial [Elusimicrobiota bacterium]